MKMDKILENNIIYHNKYLSQRKDNPIIEIYFCSKILNILLLF